MASGVGTVTSCSGSSLLCRPFSALPGPMTKCPAGTDTMSGQVSQSLKLEPASCSVALGATGGRSPVLPGIGRPATLVARSTARTVGVSLPSAVSPAFSWKRLIASLSRVLTLSAARVTEIAELLQHRASIGYSAGISHHALGRDSDAGVAAALHVEADPWRAAARGDLWNLAPARSDTHVRGRHVEQIAEIEARMLVEILDERARERRMRAWIAIGGEIPRQGRVGDEQRAVG